MPEVDLDAEVRGTGNQLHVGVLLQGCVHLVQGLRTKELRLTADPGMPRRRRGAILPVEQRITFQGLVQRVRGVPDGTVTRAPAQIAAQRVQVESVGPALVVGSVFLADDGCSGFPVFLSRRALRPVVLRCHGADETGGAVTALRAAAVGHLPLHRVQVLGCAGVGDVAQPLGGDDLLTVEGKCRRKARVDRGPSTPLGAVWPGHEDGAGAAFPFRATLLGAGKALIP